MVAWTAMSLDDMLQRWIEDLWETGETKNLPNDAISGLQHFIPALRGQLRGAARFLSAWGRHELPTRATPLSALFASALAGAASLARDFPMAVGILLAFHAFLFPRIAAAPSSPSPSPKAAVAQAEKNQSSLMIHSCAKLCIGSELRTPPFTEPGCYIITQLRFGTDSQS